MNHGAWLRKEIPRWVSEHLITEEAGKILMTRYKNKRISLYTGHIVLLAVVSFLVGLFFVLAGTWNDLTQDERFVATLVPVVLSGLALFFLLWDERIYKKSTSENERVSETEEVPTYRIPIVFREAMAVFHGIVVIGAFPLVNETFLLYHGGLYMPMAEAVFLILIAYMTESAGLGILSMGIPVYMYYFLPEETGRMTAVWILLLLALPLLVRLLGVYRHKAVVAYSWVWTMAILAVFGSASNWLWQTLFFSLAASLTWLAGDALKNWGTAAEVWRLIGGAALFIVLLEASWGSLWAHMTGHWFLWGVFFVILAINAVLLLSMWKEKKHLNVIAGLTPFAMLISAALAVFETTGVASAIFMSSFAVFFALTLLISGYVKERTAWKILGGLLLVAEATLRIFDSSLSYGERGVFFLVIALLVSVLGVFSFFVTQWRRRTIKRQNVFTRETPVSDTEIDEKVKQTTVDEPIDRKEKET